jgi:hypothetical protein
MRSTVFQNARRFVIEVLAEDIDRLRQTVERITNGSPPRRRTGDAGSVTSSTTTDPHARTASFDLWRDIPSLVLISGTRFP